MTLPILYQDEHLVIINKPAGLLVHRSWIDKDETSFALQLVRDKIGKYVYPVHRLDKPTSGILIFALDKNTTQMMNQLFMDHKVKKEYWTVVRGYFKGEGVINYSLKEQLDKMTDSKAKINKAAVQAITHYKCLATIELPYAVSRYPVARYSLVQLEPKTGRKHQLRRHMKHVNHPIIGDTTYGRTEHNRLFREKLATTELLLTAHKVSFTHPYSNKKLEIKASFSADFIKILNLFTF